MKALIISRTESDYDYSETIIEGLFMVPDDFDSEADQQTYVNTLIAAKDARPRWTKAGKLHGAYYRKGHTLWLADLAARFEGVPYVQHDS